MVPRDQKPPKQPLQVEIFTGAVQEPFSLSRTQVHGILSGLAGYHLPTLPSPSCGFQTLLDMDLAHNVTRCSHCLLASGTTTNYY